MASTREEGEPWSTKRVQLFPGVHFIVTFEFLAYDGIETSSLCLMLGYSDGIRMSDRKLHCETVALAEGLRGSCSHVRRWSGRLGRCQDSEALESSSESGSEWPKG